MKFPSIQIVPILALLLSADTGAQTTPTLSSVVANTHAQVQQAIQQGDLSKASQLAFDLMKAIQAEADRQAPTPQDRLAKSEATWQHGAQLEPARRIYYILYLPSVALEARDYTKATYYANLLVDVARQAPTSPVYDQAMFEGNMALGRVRVQQADLTGAKQALLDASGYLKVGVKFPHLRYELAQELLDRGERDAVIVFLQKTSTLAGADVKRTSELVAAVKGGTKPSLSPWK